jgi:hypothetical protein
MDVSERTENTVLGVELAGAFDAQEVVFKSAEVNLGSEIPLSEEDVLMSGPSLDKGTESSSEFEVGQ